MTEMDPTDDEDGELYPEETVLDETEALLELFTIGAKRRQADFRRWVVRVAEEDEDNAQLALRAVEFYRKFIPIDQVRLIDLACGFWPAGPQVCGALLHEVVGDREKIELLFEHAGEDMLRWFRRVPLDSLMSEEEVRALQALPPTVNAYHRTSATGGPIALGPFWDASNRGAGNEGTGIDPASRLVRATLPRSAVLVYHFAGDGSSMIVDYRRATSVEFV